MRVATVFAISAVVAAIATTATANYTPQLGNYTQHVDTRIGTGSVGYGVGQMNPGAQVPFGAMRLGPDTTLGLDPLRLPFDNYGGYYYSEYEPWIKHFSHTHLVGAGEGDFQNFGVTMTRAFNESIITDKGYKSRFSHDDEIAVPGYYAATLETWNVRAEVTVGGTHHGMHRYTCRNASTMNPCVLMINMCASFNREIDARHGKNNCVKAQITNLTSTIVEGWLFNHGSLSGDGFNIYFSAEMSIVGFTGEYQSQTWENSTIYPREFPYLSETQSHSLGAAFTITPTFDMDEVVVHLRTGISFISAENARYMRTLGDGVEFNDMQVNATTQWDNLLGLVDVQGPATATSEPQKVFYSALYRAHEAPTIYNERGMYLGEDNQLHPVPDQDTNFMSDLSIWDIYRTQQPLLVLTNPKAARNTIWTMHTMFNETGNLPKWVLYNQETGTMVGHHSAIVMSDGIRKGIKGLDAQSMLDAIVTGIRQQNQKLMPNYYYNYMGGYGQGSDTLDYAVDAGAVIALAKMLGNQSIVDEFTPFAESFKNVWVNSSELFCPRFANGSFLCPVEPTFPYTMDVNYYVEGNAVEYRWYVPHNLRQLVSLFKSRDDCAQKLDYFFSDSKDWIFGNLLPNPQFWAGNEPDILAPAIFPFIGNEYAWLSSKWFPWVLRTYYVPRPSGLPGNDDYGTMSAFCAFGYMGIYPVASTNEYAIFTPQFQRLVLSIDGDSVKFAPYNWTGPNGGVFLTITATNIDGSTTYTGNGYVANATLNGVALSSAIFTHDALLNGPNSLELSISNEPTVFGQPSPANGGPQPFIPAPGDPQEKSRTKKLFSTLMKDLLGKL